MLIQAIAEIQLWATGLLPRKHGEPEMAPPSLQLYISITLNTFQKDSLKLKNNICFSL